MQRRAVHSLLAAGTLAALLPGLARAQAGSFPDKPIRIVVPFTPGGTNDIIGRLIASKLTERHGWQTLVENRGGAGGAIGAAMVAAAPPDGYTLLSVSTTHTIIAAVQKINYHPATSFTPIALVGTAPSAIVATPSLPVKNLADLIALAKQQPGRLSYSSAGIGSFSQFIGELFNAAAGVKLAHVAYKGGTPAMNDVMAGHVQVYHGGLAPLIPLIRSGKMRALAVTSRERSPAAPDIPAVSETLPGFDASLWYGIFGPAGMPADVTTRLNAAISAIMKDPAVVRDLEAQGITPRTSTPEEFSRLVAADVVRWAEVARTAGIKGE